MQNLIYTPAAIFREIEAAIYKNVVPLVGKDVARNVAIYCVDEVRESFFDEDTDLYKRSRCSRGLLANFGQNGLAGEYDILSYSILLGLQIGFSILTNDEIRIAHEMLPETTP